MKLRISVRDQGDACLTVLQPGATVTMGIFAKPLAKTGAVRAALSITMASALIAGCVSRPQESREIRTLLPMEAVDIKADANEALGRNHASAKAEIADDGAYTVLALSSGGADGAFGAGVMKGWTQSGQRPEFDVVTGVSTGALMSVLVFLGPRYDQTLEQLYTTISNQDLFKKRGLAAVFSDSLYDYEPLKRQIAEIITEQILDDIATEHDKGRRLFVATTNLDAGELVVWDMGEIAKGGRSDSLLHFRKVLRASAAVPGFFTPVYIKPRRGVQLRQAHVDGGVKAPILIESFMLPADEPNKMVYAIINANQTRRNASVPINADLASIAQKSIAELMRELMNDTVFRGYVTSVNAGAIYRQAAIPDEIPISQESLDFDPVRMRELYQAGYQIGLKGQKNWPDQPNNLSNYEKLVRR